ncbi:hypothetical protein [Marinobacter caseinilyticus]|uniref:hypothetical protein n=1 Tax=Marinobacter caseinilyticus TaxID=2692195 RepID=UPI00140CADD6|nr:hypothetical protein [Marinobacter caseinilyticus]
MGQPLGLFAAIVCLISWPMSAATAERGLSPAPGPESGIALTVEGIARVSEDRDPRVLYILPWQPPTLPKRPRVELDSDAPALMAPVNPEVFERHRYFRHTLDPNLGSAPSSY